MGSSPDPDERSNKPLINPNRSQVEMTNLNIQRLNIVEPPALQEKREDSMQANEYNL